MEGCEKWLYYSLKKVQFELECQVVEVTLIKSPISTLHSPHHANKINNLTQKQNIR